MGLSSAQPVHARDRAGPPCRDDRRHAPPQPCRRLARTLAGLILPVVAALAGTAPGTRAEPLRIATFSPELSRKGPGLLLRDILKREDPQIAAAVAAIAAVDPDILLLTGIDWDLEGRALDALAGLLAEAGAPYPHRFAPRPNTGLPSGADLDGDGRPGRPRDAQGYGRFAGEGGMALLSRHPVIAGQARDFSALLWRDLPGAQLPEQAGAPFPSEAAQAVQRLSSTGHWAVPVAAPGGTVTLLAFAATPPVFDGPEDRNGLRNADEIRFWLRFLDGAFGAPPRARFVLLGNANLDPVDGEGLHGAIAALLADPRLQDPAPESAGGRAAATPGHRGDPAQDTADWWEEDDGPGNLRVDYVLPSAEWRVPGAGVPCLPYR